MNEEEKEAIEDSIEKKYREVIDFYKKLTKEECFYILNNENKYYSEVKSFALLNLINLIEQQKAELEKKDKIIDLMVDEMGFNHNINSIVDVLTIKKQLKEYFEKKAEEDKQC